MPTRSSETLARARELCECAEKPPQVHGLALRDGLGVAREARLAVAPERIWPVVDDPMAMSRWFAFAERIELLDGADTGRKQRLYGHSGRRRSEIDREVVVYEPPRELAWRHVAERLDSEPVPRFAAETLFTIRLMPDGDGSRVRLESRQWPAGRTRRLAMRLFGQRQIAALLEQSLSQLRDACAGGVYVQPDAPCPSLTAPRFPSPV